MAWIMHENEKKIEIVGPQLVYFWDWPLFLTMISDLLKNSSNSCRIFVVSDYIVQALSMVHSLHKKLPFGCSQGHELKNKMQYLDPIYLLWTTIKSLSAEIHMSKVVKLVAAFWSDLRTHCLKVQVDPPVMHEFI